MKLSKGRVCICMALTAILVVGVVAPTQAALFGLWKSKKRPSMVEKESVVVFPFDQPDTIKLPETFGEYVASDLRYVLGESDRYCVLLYKDRLAPIARALSDNTIRQTDAAPPYTEEKEKALKLAQLLATDLFVTGSIDDLQVDTSKKVAVITLSAQLVDAKTGKLVKTLLVTGRTPESVTTAEEDELRDIAKGDAVAKLNAELTASKKAPETETEAQAQTAPNAPASAGEASAAADEPAANPGNKASETAAK